MPIHSEPTRDNVDAMKNRKPIRLVAATAATLLATAWLCRAGEVSYLETFDTYP